jgi:hypothetical protein
LISGKIFLNTYLLKKKGKGRHYLEGSLKALPLKVNLRLVSCLGIETLRANIESVASKDDNWAGKYVFDLRSLTAQQKLNDPRHNLADFYYTRIRVLITYNWRIYLHNKLYNYFTMQDRYKSFKKCLIQLFTNFNTKFGVQRLKKRYDTFFFQ